MKKNKKNYDFTILTFDDNGEHVRWVWQPFDQMGQTILNNITSSPKGTTTEYSNIHD